MGTNGTTAGVAGVEILIAGQPLDPTLTPLLQEVRVEDNLTLPDAFLLRISDPGLKHVDTNPLEVGSEIEIRIGGPDAKQLTPLIKGVSIALCGGLGSVQGAVIAAILLGLVEALTNKYLGGQFVLMTQFIVIIVVLIVRPRGISGLLDKAREQ